MLTERDIRIILTLVRYYLLNRVQIQRLVFPDDKQGRVTRRRLQMLVDEHYINRQSILIAHNNQSAAPVYFPARKGCELLAEHFDDPQFLLTPTQAPIPHHTQHWLAVSDTQIAFNAAVEGQAVQIEDWINEWDVVNKAESAPEKRFRLYTMLRENPRLVCAPDAAFLMCAQGHKKAFYLEQDRATSGVTQIAASKTPGYAMMAEVQAHRRHFPATTLSSFTVLMVAPNAKRRDSLRRAVQGKAGAQLWRFVAAEDLQADLLLYEPVTYPADGDEPKALLRRA